ncbi:MAG TPA: glycosyltransferase [Isosphaeraceae bacterium]|nr:glycosyltransferase [Isosphaeraceae bacterium]
MTTGPPLISVCLPVYNARRYVAQAVESILGQTLGDFEFLILDDGSTDGSRPILEGYAARDPRIRLTSRANRGLVATLNELIDQARGEFLARMDADDIALPDRFRRQVDYLRAHPECSVVGCRARLIDPDGDPLCDWFTERPHEEIDTLLLREDAVGSVICHPSVLMRRDAVLAAGKYRDFAVGEELDLFLRLAESSRLAILPDVLLEYRQHPESFTHRPLQRTVRPDCRRAIVADARRRRNLPRPPAPAAPIPAAAPTASQAAASDRENWVWWALGAGNVGTARKHAWRIFARNPLALRSWRLVYCALRGR